MWPLGRSNLQQLVDAKDAERTAAIAEGLNEAGPATEDDHQFLCATGSTAVAVHIARQVQSGQWTAGQVVRAYVRRAALVHSRFNCFTTVRFKEAIEEADALDTGHAAHKTTRGRLLGVPITIKDQYDLAGYDTSNGYSSWANNPSSEDAGLVKILRDEGGIVLGKTNVCQTLLFFETVNPVFGRTSNPWNPKHTCGGSSGGEATALSADASALGIGTDKGGSLRIPSFYCGIYTLKPTLGRITKAGLSSTCPGFDGVAVVGGPMGRSVEDIDMVARVAFGQATQVSEALPPVPYREFVVTPSTHLRFGFYTFDGCMRASPATQRAVLETVAALRNAGHEVVEFTPPDITTGVELFVGLTSADGYSTMMEPIGSDPTMDELFLVTLGPRLPGFVRSIVGWLVEKVLGDEKFRRTFNASKTSTVAEYFKLNTAHSEYINRWYKEVWDHGAFDGLIVPSQAIPAPPHGSTKMVPQLAASTFIFNLLDFPTGVIPVTRVDATEDVVTSEWLATGPSAANPVFTEVSGATPLYDAKAMSGLPVGVQIVGRRWEDEKVLAMMRIADDALGKRSFGPGSWTP
ncbi:amidase signature enzyme [Exidia glandulosa HHB12029]|uniref:amidase n=1 Tax=Exidia glandulosa HHB12029 TaxID=1314781 RepID=A0A165JYJ1_EXIGL|nr:amidase signature enzyme [Exidia glandulosa HHB12029]